MEIGYCLDCNELNYAMTNANGNFERANMSNNHEGHRQYIFEEPEKYTPPIRNVLTIEPERSSERREKND